LQFLSNFQLCNQRPVASNLTSRLAKLFPHNRKICRRPCCCIQRSISALPASNLFSRLARPARQTFKCGSSCQPFCFNSYGARVRAHKFGATLQEWHLEASQPARICIISSGFTSVVIQNNLARDVCIPRFGNQQLVHLITSPLCPFPDASSSFVFWWLVRKRVGHICCRCCLCLGTENQPPSRWHRQHRGVRRASQAQESSRRWYTSSSSDYSGEYGDGAMGF